MKQQKKQFLKKNMGALLCVVMLFAIAVPSLAFADTASDAAAYLDANYTNRSDGGKIITTGGTGVTQSGTTCTIGLQTSSGGSITSFRLRTEGSSSIYKSGWYVEDQSLLSLGSKTWNPANPKSTSFNRPTAAEGAKSFIATLMLFDRDTTTDDAINDGTAKSTALASKDFTITILPEAAKYNVTFKAVDSNTKAEISAATVSLQYNWSNVPSTDGVYKDLESDKTYSLTISADGYKNYTNYSWAPTASGEVEIPLEAIVYSKITFNVINSAGEIITNPTVSVRKSYSSVAAESDGSYKLQNGESYTYIINASGYGEEIGSITPTADQNIEVTLKKVFSVYKVTFKAVCDSDAVSDATVKVTYEDDDVDWGEDPEIVTVTPNTDGSYSLKKGTTYTYSITAEHYETATGTYSPEGESETITKTVEMTAKEADQSAKDNVAAIKKLFDAELGSLRPSYLTYKNINDLVLKKIQGYEGITSEGVSVSVKTTEDTTYIAQDGTINYNKSALNEWGNNSKNISCTFVIKYQGAQAVTDSRVVTVGWNQEVFKENMRTEANTLSWDSIKGTNTAQDNVTSDLTLPRIMGTSARKVWSEITWESSNTDVISIENTGYGSLIDPQKGKITSPVEDTEVTLTATFKANDAVLNTNVENVADFGTITKTFKVVVKGTGEAKPSEEDLLAILNKYYTAESLTDFTTKEVIDSSNVTGDIQLLRYTRVKDENNNTVFNNKEITVTSDNENIIKINGYRASVDIFASQNKTEKVNLVITFTRDGVTVSKKIPLTVNMITDEELDTEITLMENVKKHYFDGINDGRYTDKDSITGNLHAFCEAVLDEKGNVIWIYDAALQKGTGIIPDDQFTDTWEMEAAGYNKFKSSNNAVVQHENLVVVQPENSTQITISSVLSSEKYGQFAQSHPDNEKLQKLYKQPVSVTVTVEGTKDTEVEPEDPTDKAEATLKVIVNTESGSPAEAFTVKAASDTAKSFGFEKPSEFANKVTILDIVVALHSDVYGDDFKNAPSDYLQIGKSNDQIFKIFGEENSNLSYLLNNEYPADASGNMTTLSKTAVSDGDVLNIFFYGDTKYYSDVYLYFTKADVSVKADDEFSLTLMKMGFDMTTFENVIAPQNGCKVSLTDGEGEVVAIGTTDENGVVKFIVSKAGSYSADVIKAPYDYFVSAHADVKVEAGIITPDTDKAPKTGDDGKIFAWIALMMVSGGFALVITAKKKNCIK